MKSKKELLTIPKEEYKWIRTEYLTRFCDVLTKYTTKYKRGLLADDEYFLSIKEIAKTLGLIVQDIENNPDY